jgi:cation diffusion facilitator family transporter
LNIITNHRNNIKAQWLVCITALVLFTVKIIAWYLTNSVAVLTDALESIVNVISGFFGLYSLYLSSLPRDKNHPYGHGKVEFLSAGIEGVLIILAGFIIIYESINNLQHPHKLSMLDIGLVLIAASAVVNYFVGMLALKRGKRNNSLALVASGKHLQTDTISTVGIILGLLLIRFTGMAWIDSAVAILFAFIIIYSGVKIVRKSVAGMMDETDEELLKDMVEWLQKNRSENWVDLHNLRIIKYGSVLHFDCHLTVPWYFNVHEAHSEVDKLQVLLKDKFGDSFELFVHTDGCLDFSCTICNKKNCEVRKREFTSEVIWTVDNISTNTKHGLGS